MAEPITTAHKPEVLETGHKRVACNGPVFSQHPKVFLTMVDDATGHPDHVVCPYCSRVYRYSEKLAAAQNHGHH